jgi:hypothetical protein
VTWWEIALLAGGWTSALIIGSGAW